MTGKARWILVAVMLAGATCLAIGVGSARWWTIGDVVQVRPTGMKACFEAGSCTSDDLSWLGGGELWRRAGVATWAGGMLTALTMVALAGALAAKRRATTVAGVTLVAAITAIVAALVFVLRFPGMTWPDGMAEGLHPPASHFGAGPLLYLIGALAAAAVAIKVVAGGASARTSTPSAR